MMQRCVFFTSEREGRKVFYVQLCSVEIEAAAVA
jgi:hypothetical protein